MKIWTNNKFEGHWPAGTAAVVVANNADEAAKYLSEECCYPDSIRVEDMVELPQEAGIVRILCDGEY